MLDFIKHDIEKLNSTCAKHNVSQLYIFGSAVTKDFTPHSDIDFLVTFENVNPFEYFDNFMDFKNSLETLYDRKVDLVESQTIKNPILKRSIDRRKKLVYGRENSQVLV